jgi:hypothetical protein
MKRPLLNELRRLADGRCDYCRMPERFDPLPFQVDHIIAAQHRGPSGRTRSARATITVLAINDPDLKVSFRGGKPPSWLG